jgi:hypothetical protein
LEDATEDEDRLYDAVKLKGNPSLSFSMMNTNTEYAIMAIPPVIEERTISLQLEVGEAGTYTFTPNTMENFEGYTVYLNDIQTGMSVMLQEGQSIDVALQAGDYSNRFYLNFSTSSITGIEESEGLQLNAWISANRLNIQMDADVANANIQLIDMSGRVISRANNVAFQNGRSSISCDGLATGIYTVLVATDASIESKKVLVK